MQKWIFLAGLFFLLHSLPAQAQKTEAGYDFSFKPTTGVPRYYVETEHRDSLWYRQVWYLPERSMAMQGAYKDAACTFEEGVHEWYYTNRKLKSKGTYHAGKKEGTWLEYGEEGYLRDSAFYAGGRQSGIGQKWNEEGYLIDSTNFDGAGNGVEVKWYAGGRVSSAGRWVSDTSKTGRWNYYYADGTQRATEEYNTAGTLTATRCFDEKGVARDSGSCKEIEAEFSGGLSRWTTFIQRNLKADVPVRAGAPVGTYQVVTQFVVGKDGTVSDVKALTKYGYGMEEEVMRVLKKSPRWSPALQWGTPVKAYRRQPITFVVSKG